MAGAGGCPIRDAIKEREEEILKLAALLENGQSIDIDFSRMSTRLIPPLEESKNDEGGEDYDGDDDEDVEVNVEDICDDEDEEEDARMPCESCRLRSCSNCLVPFKRGEVVVTKIPAFEKSFGEDRTFVPLEVALICALDPIMPYMSWVRNPKLEALVQGMESEAKKERIFPSFLREMFHVDINVEEYLHSDDASDGDDSEDGAGKGSKEDQESVDNRKMTKAILQAEKEFRNSATWTYERKLALVRKMIIDITAISSDFPSDPYEADTNRMTQLARALLDEVEKDPNIQAQFKSEPAARRVAETILKENLSVPDFRFCMGCGQLLSVLFLVWERLDKGILPEKDYFKAVISGYSQTKLAQERVMGASNDGRDKRFRLLNEYISSNRHPAACSARKSGAGNGNSTADDDPAANMEETMKHGVGHLIHFLEEGFLTVFHYVKLRKMTTFFPY